MKRFKIQESIDVYVSAKDRDPCASDRVIISFVKMTTRERIEIAASRSVADFISLLDGENEIDFILEKIGGANKIQSKNLIKFLVEKKIITPSEKYPDKINPRYSRQIAFFDDMILKRKGEETQEILGEKSVAILGCGAIGSNIAEILVRAGVKNLILVDYKDISPSNQSRHLFFRQKDIGESKVNSLSSYLKRINSKAQITSYKEIISPKTDIRKFIEGTNIVVNSCDEPYIGHTSIKIGRLLEKEGIPLYIAGGFDAHLMSSGELIFPPLTPCIDCAQKTFTEALQDWKPLYNLAGQVEVKNANKGKDPIKTKMGGPGGLLMMSGFSANLSAINIIRFLAEDENLNYTPIRHEYLINQGEFTGFEMKKQEGCNVCNR